MAEFRDELLDAVYRWEYQGYPQPNWPNNQPACPEAVSPVPVYLLLGEFVGLAQSGTMISAQLRALETAELIERCCCRDVWGRWQLGDGRILETSQRREPCESRELINSYAFGALGMTRSIHLFVDREHVWSGISGAHEPIAESYWSVTSRGQAEVERRSITPTGVGLKEEPQSVSVCDLPNPSPVMTLKEAARRIGSGMSSKKLRGLMKSNRVRFQSLNRESHRFSCDEFPSLCDE